MSFEKEYYESPMFWEGEMLQDPQNQERIKFTASWVPGNTKSLVDLGCGNGVFVNYLNQAVTLDRLVGVDRSEKALEFVKTNKAIADVSKLPFKNREFDCATCLEVIEHLPFPVYEQSLSEITRIADKSVIISVPYKEIVEESYNRCPSCKAIFNLELHLRSFDDEKMKHLLDKYGFQCIKTHKLGESLKYLGHYQFRKMFYKEQFLQWKSPICPICGYKEIPAANANHKPLNDTGSLTPSWKQRLISALTGIPKLIWPKEKKHYWIIAYYERIK